QQQRPMQTSSSSTTLWLARLTDSTSMRQPVQAFGEVLTEGRVGTRRSFPTQLTVRMAQWISLSGLIRRLTTYSLLLGRFRSRTFFGIRTRVVQAHGSTFIRKQQWVEPH